MGVYSNQTVNSLFFFIPYFYPASHFLRFALFPRTPFFLKGRTVQNWISAGFRTLARTVFVEKKSGVLSLIPSQPAGAPGLQNTMDGRKVRSFVIPHIPLDDVILPAEYEGIRAFGSEDQLMEMAQVLNDHLQSLKNKHDITLEHLRMGALKGIILAFMTNTCGWKRPCQNPGRKSSGSWPSR